MKMINFYRKKKMFVLSRGLLFFVGLCCVSMQVYAQNWDEIIKATATHRAAGSHFGYSVSVSGDYAIVGAPKESTDASGGNALDEAGAAYIFHNDGGTWSLVQKIVASDRGAYDYFGWSVSVSGKFAVIGAYFESQDASGGNTLNSAGSAYIFENTAGTWSQTQKIVASDRQANDYFGYAVAVSGDYLVVGAYGEDHDVAGASNMPQSGSAYIFHDNSGTWTEVQKIVASDRAPGDYFGSAVAISGDNVIVGAYRESEDASLANTLQYSGSAYIFTNNSGTWSQTQKIVANDREFDANFGISVAISGDNAIVGAFKESKNTSGGDAMTGAGAAYIFTNNSGTWSQTQKLIASDRSSGDYFGRGVAIAGNYAIVGAYLEEEDASGQNNLELAGSAYIFENVSGTWSQADKIVASDRGAGDYFGFSVAITNDFAFVGAYRESEDAFGNNTLSEAGSIYVFEKDCAADNSVTVNGNLITANLSGATYQWIDCDTGIPISGETAQSFTPSVTGSYAVEVTENGCTKVSVCNTINILSVNSLSSNELKVLPNPNNGIFTISSANGLENAKIEVYSVLGTLVFQKNITSGSSATIDLQNQLSGVYFLKVNDKYVTKVVTKR